MQMTAFLNGVTFRTVRVLYLTMSENDARGARGKKKESEKGSAGCAVAFGAGRSEARMQMTAKTSGLHSALFGCYIKE